MTHTHHIYASTACLAQKQTLSSRLKLYHNHGIEAVELGAGITAPKNDLDHLINYNTPLLIHNYFPPPSQSFVLNLASANKEIRQQSLSLVQQAMTLSARIRAPFYSVHAGFITDPVGFGTTSFIFPLPKSQTEAQAAFTRFCDSVYTILNWADQLAVSLLIENNVCTEEHKGRLLLQTAEEFIKLFRLISHPRLGMLLDTGHMKVSAKTLDFNIEAFFQTAAPYVKAVHLHDNDGIFDAHQPLTSDSKLLKLLKQTLPGDVIKVVEAKFETVVELEQHLSWLAKELSNEFTV